MPVVCDTCHYLEVAEMREEFTVSKQRTHGLNRERFNVKEIFQIDSKNKYHTEISNRFSAV
jgi:hypothetical protein